MGHQTQGEPIYKKDVYLQVSLLLSHGGSAAFQGFEINADLLDLVSYTSECDEDEAIYTGYGYIERDLRMMSIFIIAT